MSLKFGTSGLRGLSVDLEGPATALYATAFARHLLSAGIAGKGDTILVGRDFRASSPAIAAIAIGVVSTLAGGVGLVGVFTVAQRRPWRTAVAVSLLATLAILPALALYPVPHSGRAFECSSLSQKASAS